MTIIRTPLVLCLLLAVTAFKFDIPIYGDCETEYTKYQSAFKYDQNLYGSRAEDVDRKVIFCARLEVIKAHNKRALAGKETYSKGINEFTDWTDEEFGFVLLASTNRTIDYDNEYVPEEFDPEATTDFRSKLPSAKNQGGCGSCWAFSGVAVIDFLLGGSHSEQQMVDCAEGYGCNGGWADEALNVAIKYGADTETQYPYTGKDGTCKQSGRGQKISKVTKILSTGDSPTTGVSAIKSAGLKTVVSVGILFENQYNDDFGAYRSGIFSGHCGAPGGGHAINVVGVQSGYYIIRNSWGTRWGMSGYMYMKSGADICNIEEIEAFIGTA